MLEMAKKVVSYQEKLLKYGNRGKIKFFENFFGHFRAIKMVSKAVPRVEQLVIYANQAKKEESYLHKWMKKMQKAV